VFQPILNRENLERKKIGERKKKKKIDFSSNNSKIKYPFLIVSWLSCLVRAESKSSESSAVTKQAGFWQFLKDRKKNGFRCELRGIFFSHSPRHRNLSKQSHQMCMAKIKVSIFSSRLA
jgi:hypothetical protein